MCAWLQGCVQEEGLALAGRGSHNVLNPLPKRLEPGPVIWPQGPSRPRNEEEELAAALVTTIPEPSLTP